jgi:retron-type reverse transcriptase
VIYTDFSKAFDRVNHHILLSVLALTGLGEPLLSWLTSFITNRKQCVKIHGVVSPPIFVSSGVPQGGHLSPLLFTLFINSANRVLRDSQLLAFADDMKLFLQINSINDYHLLQNDLNRLVAWAETLGLSFNVSKCHSMSFTRIKKPTEIYILH